MVVVSVLHRGLKEKVHVDSVWLTVVTERVALRSAAGRDQSHRMCGEFSDIAKRSTASVRTGRVAASSESVKAVDAYALSPRRLCPLTLEPPSPALSLTWLPLGFARWGPSSAFTFATTYDYTYVGIPLFQLSFADKKERVKNTWKLNFYKDFLE